MTTRCSDIRETILLLRQHVLRFGLLLAMLLVLSTGSMAQKKGRLVRPRSRVVDRIEHFDRISIGKNINVVIEQGDKQQIAIVAEPTVNKEVVCEVNSGRLYVYAGKFKYKQSPRIDVTITCDSTLQEIHGESGSNINSRGLLKAQSMLLNADFAIEMHISVIANDVTINAHKKSVIWLTGRTNQTTANLDGASFLRMKQTKSNHTNITATQESAAEVCAEQSLNIVAADMSEVSYYAPNAVVSSKTEDGGRVMERKLYKNL